MLRFFCDILFLVMTLTDAETSIGPIGFKFHSNELLYNEISSLL